MQKLYDLLHFSYIFVSSDVYTMKRIIIIAVAILMAFSSAAQMMPDSTVQIVSYWQVGDKYEYSCERSSKEVDAQGDTTSRDYSMEIMEFEVVGMTEDTYQLRLTYKDAEYSDEMDQAIHDIMNEIAGNYNVLFSTNRMGALISIDNLQELTTSYKSAYEKAAGPITDMVMQSLTPEEREGFDVEGLMQQLMASVANPQAIQTAILDDIGRLFFFHGARLQPGETYSMEEPLNFIMPGMEQMTAETKLWAEKDLTDSFSTVCRTYTAATIGEDAMKSAISDQVNTTYDHMKVTDSLRTEIGNAFDDYMAQTKIKTVWEQYTSEEIHLATGWPLSFYQDKYVLIETGDDRQEKIESYYLEIILPE